MNVAALPPLRSKLHELLRGLTDCWPDGQPTLEIRGVQLDSRKIGPGDLFLAIPGRSHDARQFVGEALRRGAAAVAAEPGGEWQGLRWIGEVPVIAVGQLLAKASEIAGRHYRHPAAKMSVLGITGTNGKTTCSQFLAELFARVGCPAGIIGTLGHGRPGVLAECPLTTPDAVFAQRALAQLAAAGCEAVAMEVSSIGLHQQRVAAVRFETAIFTNLTRDHLDYHGSMENYGAAKRRLFASPGLRHAVVNLDDPLGPQIVSELGSRVQVFTYGIAKRNALIRAEGIATTQRGFRARIHTPVGSGVIDCKLLGRFNVGNVLAVIGALLASEARLGELAIEQLCELVSGLQPVAGRMEVIEGGDIATVIDYSHTPDGLESALKALREHFAGRIWCVFGCGGNRDKGKRPLMGAIAERLADQVVLADDNPRLEDGDEIVSQIRGGMTAGAAVLVERDREAAIHHALGAAAPGDVVLIAGKGHEDYQQSGTIRRHFSDVEVTRRGLGLRAAAEAAKATATATGEHR